MSKDQARAMIDYSLAAMAAVLGINVLLVILNILVIFVLNAPQISQTILGVQSLATSLPGAFLLMALGVVGLFFKRKSYNQLYFDPGKEALFMVMPLIFSPILIILAGIVLYIAT